MKLSKVWMIASLIIITVLSIITNSSIIQIVAAICGVIYVFGTATENRYGQLFGMVNSGLYGIIMFNNKIFGTAIYDFIYCIPIQIYTFINWGKNKQGEEKTKVSTYTKSQRAIILLLTILLVSIYCIIVTKFNFQFALIDGISIILGVVGLYMTSKKKLEQWYVFIVSNIAMFVLWSIKTVEDISNLPMLLMWIIYFVNNSYGLFSWSRKIKLENNEQKS